MLSFGGRKFLAIERNTFDLISDGRQTDGLRICENGRGYRVTIFLENEEVKWFLESLEEFYWGNQVPWLRSIFSRNRELGIAFGSNRRGLFLSLFEGGGKRANRIFIPKGEQGKGWWVFMNQAFELVNRLVINPSPKGRCGGKMDAEGRVDLVQLNPWNALIQCPLCSTSIHVAMEVDGSKSYAVAL